MGSRAHPTRGQIKTVLDGLLAQRQIRTVGFEVHGPAAQKKLARAGAAAARTLDYVGARLAPGITTQQIDTWVREHTRELGGRPSQLGYRGFPAAVCTSRNAVVCHGIPASGEALAPGDIINIDITTELDGYHGDTSRTFLIGPVSPEAQRLVEVTERCLYAGISVVRHGARLGDIGAAIGELARREGFTVVREFGGHGIGQRMHQPPHVAHEGVRGVGPKLVAGMAFTIEPMLCAGLPDIRLLDDGWTVLTADGQLSAQFEHTVLVTRGGARILTLSSSATTVSSS